MQDLLKVIQKHQQFYQKTEKASCLQPNIQTITNITFICIYINTYIRIFIYTLI